MGWKLTKTKKEEQEQKMNTLLFFPYNSMLAVDISSLHMLYVFPNNLEGVWKSDVCRN